MVPLILEKIAAKRARRLAVRRHAEPIETVAAELHSAGRFTGGETSNKAARGRSRR